MKLPEKITPCPVIEAIVELRFNSALPPDAIFGMLYERFAKEYPTAQSLPITQIPEKIRLNDPNLIFKPYHRISNDRFLIQIGPKVVVFICNTTYVGWAEFSRKAKEVFGIVQELKIPSELVRLGIRYINFFNENIFDHIKPNISLKPSNFDAQNMFFRGQVNTGKFISALQISNDAEIIKDGVKKRGSILDIDAFLEGGFQNPSSSIDTILENGHIEEKSLFFGLLKETFLSKFNPEYAD